MFEIGQIVGPYQIVAQLGQGGMATVYKAYQASLDRYVALKAMHPVFKQDENFLKRFEREARLVAKMAHPNIIEIYDYNNHEGNPYLVMRYVEGETLKARLQRGPLSVALITRIVESVGGALDYAHKQGILHRDVKPSNIMLTKDGHVFLTDFGLARITASGESTLSRDMMMGTPQYISPEQAKGGRELDAGTDIYSLGVVIYELIVGRVPFNADTPYAIIHDHIFTPLPLPRQVNPQVPEAIETFLLKALAKKRSDRFATVQEMIDAFLAAVEEAGEDEVAAASLVSPRPADEVYKEMEIADPSTRITAPLGAARTGVAPITPGGSVARRRKRPRRESLWVTAGLILLVITLAAGGVVFQRAVAEEYDRVFNQAETYEGN